MVLLDEFEKALLNICESSNNLTSYYDSVSAAVEILGAYRWTLGYGDYAVFDSQPSDSNSLIGNFEEEFGQAWHHYQFANVDLALLAITETNQPYVFWYDVDRHLRQNPDIESDEKELFDLAASYKIFQGFTIKVPTNQNNLWAGFSVIAKPSVWDTTFCNFIFDRIQKIERLAFIAYKNCPFGHVNKSVLEIGDEALKVLLRSAKGMKNKEIAKELGKSSKNVETLLGNAKRKLFRNEYRQQKILYPTIEVLRQQVLRKKLDMLWPDFYT